MPSPVNTSKVVPPAGLSEYIVKSGENLSVIAARYGKSWQSLWSINRDKVANPDRIFPGLKLRVWMVNKPALAKVAVPVKDDARYHIVEAGENLSVIAARYRLPSWVLLWEANKAIVPDPDYIRPGIKLRLP